MRSTWRGRRPIELGRVVVGLGANCRPAFGAHVVVFVSARQNEQELPPRRCCAAAFRAEQTGRLKLAKALALGHLLRILHRPHDEDRGASDLADLAEHFSSPYEAVVLVAIRWLVAIRAAT